MLRGVVVETPYAEQPRLDPLQHVFRPILHVRSQCPHQLIGGSGKIEDFFGVALLQIKHAEMLGIGRDRAGPDQVNEFATNRRADDEQLLTSVVQDQVDPLARMNSVPSGKGVVDDHLVVAAVGKIAAAPDNDVVDDRFTLVGQRQHDPVERRRHVLQVDRGEKLNPRANRRDARQVDNLGQLRARSLFYVDPKVGHAALGVVLPAGQR